MKVLPLSDEIWPAYADLIERHKGIWGGCWCMHFHPDQPEVYPSMEAKVAEKHRRVCERTSRAAVVMEGETALGWCQFGRAAELDPARKFKRLYAPGVEIEPDWRITCFFVDRRRRGEGIAGMALDGALRMIAEEGGGLTEAYPESIEGRNVTGTYVSLGTIPMFEKRGFQPLRQIAKHHWVMTKTIA